MKPHNPFYVSILLLLSSVLVSVFAQQPPRTLSTVDAELSKICGKESSPYAERVRLIHSLPSNLTPEQLEHCRADGISVDLPVRVRQPAVPQCDLPEGRAPAIQEARERKGTQAPAMPFV